MKDIWFGYWFKNWFLTYKIGYLIVISGIRSYFKNHEYIGKNKIPSNGGVIYAVNHQNAFLDPILIAGRTRQPTYFLTRADIFKKPFVAKLLSQLYMLPIYRQRDGANSIKKNETTFNKCYDILAEKGKLIIFPEGNHHYKKSIRPFKKGIARIALGAAEKYNYKVPIYIVPLGIDYENHFSMNGDLLLNAGDPIDISDYYKKHEKEPAETINNLSSEVYNKLEKLIINIKDIENYESIYFLLHKIPLKDKNKSILSKFHLRQERLIKIEELRANHLTKYKDLIEKSNQIKKFLNQKKIKPYLFAKQTNIISLVSTSLFMSVIFPIHIIGLFTNYLPYKIPVTFVKKNIKDKHFHGSLKYALGVILFYLYWACLILFLTIYKGWFIGLIGAVLLPFIAIFNFKYWIYLIKTAGAWRYQIGKNKAEFKKIKNTFDEVSSTIV